LVTLRGRLHVLRDGKRRREAAAAYEEAERIISSAMGAQSPRVAVALAALGEVYLEMKEPDRARRVLERARKIQRAGRGEPSLSAHTAYYLGEALAKTGGDRGRICRLGREAKERFSKHTDLRENLAKAEALLRGNCPR
jgi:tetratricopeptide (TPR) repeat protein